ncbi:amino acid ABC transporter permease [Phycicoccus endophyticus]|uniref:Amino acid ABC transporter permease n=1 Tax=Phycicoccus endophyticus TaxID=1690220 RepID=A0A7G9R3Y2_9MICO|nr:amino acid ABC transporter permease [Phycicoccus endophyticus]NHI18141.1 amino acid ABC transporter permease [Phycicoccus endophyticus]QNN50307.1 amino acid ABC transporter permease [Phycicoccus endophyticus]GGL26137.1 glutamate ABC transporter permease [Phycicoccus endophyticus]
MSTESVLFDAPGPRARLRHNILTGVGLVLVALTAWVVYGRMKEANQLEGYLWSPYVTEADVWTAYILPGLWATIKAALVSMVLAGVYGLAFGMGRLSHLAWVRWASGAVVEFFRAVPVLLMMVFFFFGFFATASWLPSDYAPLAAVVVGLTLYNGSVIAELVRSGVHSLPKGQSEAGLSIGLSPGQTLRIVQLPQALRAMLPALIGQLVVVLKDTALGTVVLYPELLTQGGKTLGSAYANTVPAYLVVAVIYIVINYSLTKVAGYVEGRMKRRRRAVVGATTTTMPSAAGGTGAVASSSVAGNPVQTPAEPVE